MKKNNDNVVLYAVLLLLSSVLVVSYLTTERPVKKYEQNKERQYKELIVKDNGMANSVARAYDATVMVINVQKDKIVGNGSGFVYKKDKKYAYILTNQHVIDGSDKVIIKTTLEEVEAKVLGGDKFLDLAVLRIPETAASQTIKFGKSEDLRIGDPIFTIGTPVGGEFFNSVTSGILSGYNREITVSVETKNDFMMNVIQTDASINPGNSGGPLLNNKGEVIGINSLKLVDNQVEGMGFAIKIEDARSHLEELEQGKIIKRPVLGVAVMNAEDYEHALEAGIKIPKGISGAAVIEIDKNSGASKAGLKKGDVITHIEDEEITNFSILKYILYKYKPGDKINLTINRMDKIINIKITLDEKKA